VNVISGRQVASDAGMLASLPRQAARRSKAAYAAATAVSQYADSLLIITN